MPSPPSTGVPRRRVAAAACAFLSPALAVYLLFVVLPIGEAFRLSLFRWPNVFSEPVFVGLDNFRQLLYASPHFSSVFWSALGHNALLLVASLATQLPLAIFLAVLLSYPLRGKWLFRTVFFAPMVMPTVAIAVLWSFIYQPEYGLLDQMIRWFSKSYAGQAWLVDRWTVMPCIILTICWRYVGFHMVLFMAGIAAIPNELYEAARIDGAGEWSAFRHVTLPLLRPTIAISATLSVIGSLKYFDLVYMMAEGAGETSRELLATYTYRLAFASGQGRFGYGAAVAVLLFIVAFAAALATTTIAKRGRAGSDG